MTIVFLRNSESAWLKRAVGPGGPKSLKSPFGTRNCGRNHNAGNAEFPGVVLRSRLFFRSQHGFLVSEIDKDSLSPPLKAVAG
jgi:hypothetical protein